VQEVYAKAHPSVFVVCLALRAKDFFDFLQKKGTLSVLCVLVCLLVFVSVGALAYTTAY
jgi:hypothetical protein